MRVYQIYILNQTFKGVQQIVTVFKDNDWYTEIEWMMLVECERHSVVQANLDTDFNLTLPCMLGVIICMYSDIYNLYYSSS